MKLRLPRINICGQVLFMGMKREICAAAAAAAAAFGPDLASGRGIAAFYAQTGKCSWAGVAASGVLMALLTGGCVHLAHRSGTYALPLAASRCAGRSAGAVIAFLYRIFLVSALCILAVEAGHMGALALPLQNGAAWGIGLALALAGAAAFSGEEILRRLGMLMCAFMLLFECLLLFCGCLPDGAQLRYAVVLKLQDNLPAALVFALLRTAAGFCISAGMAVRLAGSAAQPLRMGLLAGGWYMLLLGCGNAVLRNENDRLLALEYPFAALAGGWGSTGFYLCATVVFLSAAVGMAAILSALASVRNARKMMLNYK